MTENHGPKNHSRGMTLIEIIVAVTIMGIILSLGLIISFDSFRGYAFRSELSTIVSLLERARSRSLNNLYQSPHGVCFDNVNNNYVIFRGPSFGGAITQETTPASPSMTISSSTSPSFFCNSGLGIVFSQITGKTSASEVVLIQNERTSTTTINYEGTIIW